MKSYLNTPSYFKIEYDVLPFGKKEIPIHKHTSQKKKKKKTKKNQNKTGEM